MMVVRLRASRTRVVVMSEQSLIAESVRAALADAGYDAILVRWPVGPTSPTKRVPAAGTRVSGTPRLDATPDLALMLCDFVGTAQVVVARGLITRLDVPWVVLTGVPPGPAWGAVLDSGAQTVMPTTTTLESLTGVLDGLIEGRHPFAVRRRRQLVREWRDHEERLRAARVGLDSLTPRERDVLNLLHTGMSVRGIATQFDVSEATVRSQVKAVLRKFDVSSQLAAVAAFELIQGTPRTTP